jgi:hypothetical protein
MKCETCIPLIDCDFFRTNFDDAVLEELMIACPEDARLLACDVLDAACDLRDRGVNLNDRAAIEAAVAGRYVGGNGQRSPGFIERAIRCAGRHWHDGHWRD